MSRIVTEARAFDYLYDPNVTVTSARDFNRSNASAFKRGVVRVAEAENLFSSLPHHPQARYRQEPPKDLPQNVSTEYDTRVKAATLHATLHPVPSGEGAIMGASRPKFFKRPNVAVLDPLQDRLKLDTTGMDGDDRGMAEAGSVPSGGSGEDWDEEYGQEPDGTAVRSIAVQTAYRDSAAQTDAYTPEYTVPAGTEPALLQLAHLRVGGAPGAALPAGEAEIEAIRVARRRTKVKANLPPVSDEVSLELRKKLLEQLELDALVERERGMDDLGAARVAAVETALRERESTREFVSEQRVEDLRRRLQSEVDIAHAITQARRVKLLRKLGRQRKAEEAHVDMLTGTGTCLGLSASVPASKSAPGSPRAATKVPGKGRRATRDIISEYADYGSTVYAPLAREGRFPDKLAPVPRRGGAHAAAALTTHGGLVDLSLSLAGRTVGETASGPLTASIPRPVSADAKSAAAERLKTNADADLERVYSALQTAKRGGVGATGAAAEGVPAWRKPKVILDRPPTPTWDDVDETEEEAALDAATLFLQAVFRGRADQLAMLEGVSRREDLLEELRAEVTDAYLLGRAERGQAPEPVEAAEAAAAALAAGMADVTDAVLGALVAESLQGLLASSEAADDADVPEWGVEAEAEASLAEAEAAVEPAVEPAPAAQHAHSRSADAAPAAEAAESPRTGAPEPPASGEVEVAAEAAGAGGQAATPSRAASDANNDDEEEEGGGEGVGDMPALSLSTRASLVLSPEDLPPASSPAGSGEGGDVPARPPTRSARPASLVPSPTGRVGSSRNLYGAGLAAEGSSESVPAEDSARPDSIGAELAAADDAGLLPADGSLAALAPGADAGSLVFPEASAVTTEEGEDAAAAAGRAQLELRASPVRAASVELGAPEAEAEGAAAPEAPVEGAAAETPATAEEVAPEAVAAPEPAAEQGQPEAEAAPDAPAEAEAAPEAAEPEPATPAAEQAAPTAEAEEAGSSPEAEEAAAPAEEAPAAAEAAPAEEAAAPAEEAPAEAAEEGVPAEEEVADEEATPTA